MKHRKKNKKLGRTTVHRKATLYNLFTALIMNESIKTTESKAKALKKFADKMLSKAIKADLNIKRKFKSELGSKEAYYKLFETVVPQYKDRNGGYVRIIKDPLERRGDGSEMSIVELV
ncbi:MAG: 50S ribosomal protein L17 [candidate division WOR-3 bacterium]|nr:50S ribosomal protein L17 [candidate division WOR-3 bacterium]